MKKLSRTQKFYLVSIGSTLFFACLGKILFILYKTVSADIMITESASFFLRSLPYISSFCAELISRGTFVLAICSTVYTISYFGKMTGVKSVIASIACLFAGELLLFLYNITRNIVGKASILAWLVSVLLELLFSSILLWISYFIAYYFSLRRFHAQKHNRWRQYSPTRGVLLSLALACFLHIVILSATKVIPFLLQYQNVTAKEAIDIVYDYGYYIFWHLGISFLWTIPCMKLLEKATGRLHPKDYKTIS